jgi:hypothetical protein
MVSDNRQAAISAKMKRAGKQLRLSKPDAYLFKQSLLHEPQRRQTLKALREMRKRLRLMLHLKSDELTRAAILFLRRLIRFMEKLYPIARGIAAGAVMLGIVYGAAGCSGGGGGGGSSGSGTDTTPTTLTLAQKIEKVQTEAAAKGCTVVDTNTSYSILAGGVNSEGNNNISRQGDQIGALESFPTDITITCNGQNINFVFADDITQSPDVQKANEEPVGDINAFFKSDKTTEADVEAFITEKLNATVLCRFSIYPLFTGSFGYNSSETLTIAIGGIDCGTPQWFINGNTTPAGTGNTLVVGSSNLSVGENDITITVINPAGTSSFYLKRTRQAYVNQPAKSVTASMTSPIYKNTPVVGA